MSEIKLLPCPFCGGKAFIRKNSDVLKTHTAYCGNLDCSVLPKVSCYGKETTIKLWNTRKPMQEIVERLEEVETRKREYAEEELEEFCLEMFHFYESEADGIKEAIEIVKEVGGANAN